MFQAYVSQLLWISKVLLLRYLGKIPRNLFHPDGEERCQGLHSSDFQSVLKRLFKGRFSQPLPGFPVCDTPSVHSLLLLSHSCPQKQRFGLKAPDPGLQPQNPPEGLISDSSPRCLYSSCSCSPRCEEPRGTTGMTAAPWAQRLELWR